VQKTAEPIEIPFGMWTQSGPRKRNRWGPNPHPWRSKF